MRFLKIVTVRWQVQKWFFFAQKDIISQSPSSVASRDVLLVATAYEGILNGPANNCGV